MKPLAMPQTVSSYFGFKGGLDLVSPPIEMKPGVCRGSSNVEVGVNGGIKTIVGYERFDGRTSPSSAQYHILLYSNAAPYSTYEVGASISGATSGATAVIIFFAPRPSDWLDTTVPYLVLTKVVGTFVDGETITGGTVGTAEHPSYVFGTNMPNSAPTIERNAYYKNLAADKYRADIAAVPGSGSVLGVHQYKGALYAIRNNADATAAVLHKNSATGWTAVALGRELAFTSGGTTEILVGNTITGATSGAKAVITKVVRVSGTWADGTAAGRLYFASQTGTFQAEDLNIGDTLNVATIAGNSTANTLAPSGRYEFVNHNFGGTVGLVNMYGCSGTHKAFEFDGTVFAFIHTGMTDDKPKHVIAHKKHLFLSFAGSIQHSGIGTPHLWSVVTGAAEIAVGDTVTNFMSAPGYTTGGALVIYTRNSTYVLYGNSSSDWNLAAFSPDSGAMPWTAQYTNQGIALDDFGITLMATSAAFGNFANSSVSSSVSPYIDGLRSSAIASCLTREKNQYRLFFSGGAALYVTFTGNKIAGLMPITLANPVSCISSMEEKSGEEEIYFGSTNGFVYQMDRGTSMDGDPISWSAELAYNHFGSPRQLKQYRKATVEISGEGYAQFNMAFSMGYGDTEHDQGAQTTKTINLAATKWDSFTWDQFFWDGRTLMPSHCDLDGTAENLSLMFSGTSDYHTQITLNGATVDFTPRRALR